MDSEDIMELLFQAIDAIVAERIRNLGFDKTVVATIIENKDAEYGRYKVTTDNNITFQAFSENITYKLQEKVYVRIPANDYTLLKVITGRFIPDKLTTKIGEKGES